MNQLSERRHTDSDEYFNSQYEEAPVYVEPGQEKCSSSEKEMLVAKVGSGVVVTIHDPGLGIGGMAYTLISDELAEMFPYLDRASQEKIDQTFAPIIQCVNSLKSQGAAKTRIRIRLIGGASFLSDGLDKGTKNYVFVKEYLMRKGLNVMNEDLGGQYPRRVHFFPTSGYTVRQILRRSEDFEEYEKLEQDFQNKMILAGRE